MRALDEDAAVIDWLLEGDPAIRWQVMRDLLDEPPAAWEEERRRTVEEGWVAELLARRGADGEWPAGRWTASTWTLLLLVALGVPERHPAAQPALGALVDRFIPPDKEVDGEAPTQACRSLPPRLLAGTVRVLPRPGRSATPPARRGDPQRAVRRRRLELPHAESSAQDAQLVPHDVQRARERPYRGRPGSGACERRSAMLRHERPSSCWPIASTAPITRERSYPSGSPS